MHYIPISSVSLPLSDGIITLRAQWCAVLSLPLLMGYYFVYFNLKRCKECENRMHKPLVPLAESLTYQISSNSMTGISEEEERACLGSKNWTPGFVLCRQLIWSVECFFLRVPEERGLSLDSCSEEDLTTLAPYLVFWQICRILNFSTFVSASPRQVHCLAARHTELCSTPFALHGQSSVVLSWLVYQTGFTPLGLAGPFCQTCLSLKL